MPGCSFRHLLLGFFATYESHVCFGLSLYRHESDFVQLPCFTVGDDVGDDAVDDAVDDVGDAVGELVLLHFLLQIDGQKNFNFLSVPGCSFRHLLLVYLQQYESHI